MVPLSARTVALLRLPHPPRRLRVGRSRRVAGVGESGIVGMACSIGFPAARIATRLPVPCHEPRGRSGGNRRRGEGAGDARRPSRPTNKGARRGSVKSRFSRQHGKEVMEPGPRELGEVLQHGGPVEQVRDGGDQRAGGLENARNVGEDQQNDSEYVGLLVGANSP